MDSPYGILIFGPNGSGKTTLGRELAQMLGFKQIDHEDYHFIESEIPYTAARPWEECLRLMLTDIEKHGSFVLSAVTGDFGDIIPKYYRLAVYLSAPKELRMQRIDDRAFKRHAQRVLPGGDMHNGHTKFMEFAANRPLSKIDRWAETLTCPVIHLDGTRDIRLNAEHIAAAFNAIKCEVQK